jgi:hypothetical protein
VRIADPKCDLVEKNVLFVMKKFVLDHIPIISVPDPGSGAFMTPGPDPGWEKFRIRDPG